jgi:hypothetical protein
MIEGAKLNDQRARNSRSRAPVGGAGENARSISAT